MKALQITTLTLLFGLTNLILSAQENLKYTLNNEMFKVEFNSTWTWEDIVAVKQELHKHNIRLNYTLLEFSQDGLLKRISASLTYKDGMSASFESRELQASDGPGFRRNFIKHPIN